MIIVWYFLCGILGLALLVGACFALALFLNYWFMYFIMGCGVIMAIIFIFSVGYFIYNLIYENFIRQKIKINRERIIDALGYLFGIVLMIGVPVVIGMNILV